MDPIKGLSQITEILRQKVSERPSNLGDKDVDPKTNNESVLNTNNKSTPDQIKRKISERIRTLSGRDRQGRKAAQLFVEVVISWEFGDNLFQDPKFTELSNEVVDAIQKDPMLWRQMQQLLSDLENSPL